MAVEGRQIESPVYQHCKMQIWDSALRSLLVEGEKKIWTEWRLLVAGGVARP